MDIDVFELAAVGMVVTDRTGCFRRVNPAFAAMVGRSAGELVGLPFRSLTSPDDMGVSQRAMRDLLARVSETARFEKRYLRPNGALVWVDMTVRALTGPDGEVAAFLTQALDITERRVAEAQIAQQALLFTVISDGVFVSDVDGELRDCNPAAERLTGQSRAQLLATTDLPDYQPWRRRMLAAMSEGGWAGDVTFQAGRDGGRITETTIVPVYDDRGAVHGGIAVCRDVTAARTSAAALATAEERARHDALHDTLTGLPNRKFLADRFRRLARSGRLALLMIDLDRFKEVNDTLGHQCGDALLMQVSRRIQDAVRDGDTVARLGGDEFAVILPGVVSTDDAAALADRVQTALEQPFRVQGIDLDVEASIGLALGGPELDLDTVLRHADVAMYVAKRQGLGVFAYDPSADGHTTSRLGLLGELRRALHERELVLHFQPKVRISTGEVVGAEALLRWQHPTRGLLPPAEFIPLAEHTGLIRSLTRYVLDAALEQARRWIDAGWPLPVAVNLSARNLLEERLVEQVFQLLQRHGVPPELLELEITESSIVSEITKARTLLARLRGAGIRIAIDDFGAGFTSLSELRNLPVNELKVDRSFVTTMFTQPDDALIVRSVIELSHNLGLTAVAEGVEDSDVLAALGVLGCDTVQGFHVSRPLPAADFARWYEERAASALQSDLESDPGSALESDPESTPGLERDSDPDAARDA